MESDAESLTAVGIAEGEILFTGTREDAQKYNGPGTRVIELGEHALLPGFIDAHGHFTGTARFLDLANLSSPPVGTVTNIDELVNQLETYANNRSLLAGNWIMGFGYDDSMLSERRHPTREDLDRVSKSVPVAIIHVSFHFAAVNTAALEILRLDANSKNPKGGIIRREDGSNRPNGVLEETAAYAAFYPLMQTPPEMVKSALRRTASYYASFGITTAQDGATSRSDMQLLQSMAAQERFATDINLYEVVSEHLLPGDKEPNEEPDNHSGVRLAGVKLILDGSPQGRTAWLTRPYEAIESDPRTDYTAYATISEAFYKSKVAELIELGTPFLAHANGDAAIDLMLDGLEQALTPIPASDHRSVIIHAQLMRPDQIKRANALGAIPSFFSAHPYFWGDWHRLNFGSSRAENISPARWAIDEGLRFTLHNDAPMVPPDMMRLIWISVVRETRSGERLGRHQRLTVKEALQAVTLDAAYQSFEEHVKGSIRVGKQADLIVLDKNPLTVDIDEIPDIKVLETFSHGRSVYSVSDK
jgi:hypothetical protein